MNGHIWMTQFLLFYSFKMSMRIKNRYRQIYAPYEWFLQSEYIWDHEEFGKPKIVHGHLIVSECELYCSNLLPSSESLNILAEILPKFFLDWIRLANLLLNREIKHSILKTNTRLITVIISVNIKITWISNLFKDCCWTDVNHGCN